MIRGLRSGILVIDHGWKSLSNKLESRWLAKRIVLPRQQYNHFFKSFIFFIFLQPPCDCQFTFQFTHIINSSPLSLSLSILTVSKT
ncbi:hypothetical protein QVD17_17790 [Tagetes erecta]|uniref:Uncharacterized protein n=1 Tax=Tagetes erecta TaxID=13708 RepID=A0AAD8KUK8_TARER|nr:hypothetical protein QVD17_17790 [Tagetes erecta]